MLPTPISSPDATRISVRGFLNEKAYSNNQHSRKETKLIFNRLLPTLFLKQFATSQEAQDIRWTLVFEKVEDNFSSCSKDVVVAPARSNEN
jgi:hypothetical protein